MFTRQRTVALVLLLALFGLVMYKLLSPANSFDRLEGGMTLTEVERIFGSARGDVLGRATFFLATWKQEDGTATIAFQDGRTYRAEWKGADGTIVRKDWTHSPRSWLQEVRRWFQ
jgi:hypothetical protein